jgi:hypothetical protein
MQPRSTNNPRRKEEEKAKAEKRKVQSSPSHEHKKVPTLIQSSGLGRNPELPLYRNGANDVSEETRAGCTFRTPVKMTCDDDGIFTNGGCGERRIVPYHDTDYERRLRHPELRHDEKG